MGEETTAIDLQSSIAELIEQFVEDLILGTEYLEQEAQDRGPVLGRPSEVIRRDEDVGIRA